MQLIRPTTAPQAMPCFECESGTLHPVTLDHTTSHPKLGEITIPGIPMFRCDGCGDTVIGHEGSARIDALNLPQFSRRAPTAQGRDDAPEPEP